MEKIVSGQSYLYSKDGFTSEIIGITLKDKVRGSCLSQALLETFGRYPYMKSKMVEKNGCFYLEKNPNSMPATPTAKLRSLGSMATGYHLLDVTFTGQKIRVAFHHGLCDGRGVKPFVETLLYYYCKLRYDNNLSSEGIRLNGEPLLEGETAEPIGKTPFEVDSTKVPELSHEGFHLPEADGEIARFLRTKIRIDQTDFLAAAKAIGATPAIFLSILASQSIAQVHPEADKPIQCSMATDLRDAAGFPNTHKNLVGSCYLPYTREGAALPQAELAARYRQLLKVQRSPDAAKDNLNMQIGLFAKLDELKTLEEKQRMMVFFDDMSLDTYVISYLGQMHTAACDKYIESMHLYTSGSRGLTFNMLAGGGSINIDVIQSFESTAYVDAFLQDLADAGLDCHVTKCFPFETAQDRSHITSRHQAERYFAKTE